MRKRFRFVIIHFLSISLAVAPVSYALANFQIQKSDEQCAEMTVLQQQVDSHEHEDTGSTSSSELKDCCRHCKGHCACADVFSCKSLSVHKMIYALCAHFPVLENVVNSQNIYTKLPAYHSILTSPAIRPPIS